MKVRGYRVLKRMSCVWKLMLFICIRTRFHLGRVQLERTFSFIHLQIRLILKFKRRGVLRRGNFIILRTRSGKAEILKKIELKATVYCQCS